MIRAGLATRRLPGPDPAGRHRYNRWTTEEGERGMGTGAMLVWTDAEPKGEAEFNEWYNRQHIAERVGIEGFERAWRYRAISGKPRYLAMYEIAQPAVMVSHAYTSVLDDPTAWTRHNMPAFRNTNRTVFAIAKRLGHGRGAVMATLRLAPKPGQEARLQSWLAVEVLPFAVKQPGMIGGTLLQVDRAGSDYGSLEREIRGGKDETAAWTVLLEGTDVDAVRKTARDFLGRRALAANGAMAGAELGIYRLLMGIWH